MNLEEWLDKKRMTPKDFAKLVDTTRGYIYKILKGTHKPGKMLMFRINLATDGEVTSEELCGERICCPHCKKPI